MNKPRLETVHNGYKLTAGQRPYKGEWIRFPKKNGSGYICKSLTCIVLNSDYEKSK